MAAGWRELEWRWKAERRPRPPFPEWDGSPLAGRTILLYIEQGFGDTLQFIRYAPLVKRSGGTVVLACPQQSIPILSTCPGIDRFVREGDRLVDVAVQAPLLSLPSLFGTELATIPADVPYLSAEAQRVEHWRAELAASESGSAAPLRVGLAWQGSPTHREDRYRSIALAEFAPLAAVEGVRLLSLQKGLGSEQVGSVDFAVEDLAGRLDESGARSATRPR